MPQEWKPPSYATPLQSSSDSWKPPSYAIGGIKEPEKKKSFFGSIANDLTEFLASHPKLKEGLERGLTGTSPEFEKQKEEAGIKSTLGTPESEGSIFKTVQNQVGKVFPSVNQEPETYTGGFIRSLYKDFIEPMGTPSGIIGSSGFKEMPTRPPQRMLEAGPRFHVNPAGGTQDIESGLPIRQSREIPYKAPSGPAPVYDPESEYANYLKMRAAEEHEANAAVRGTPRDIPNNPQALELERLRTGRAVPANLSVQDIMKPESISTMDRMHAETNPIFKQMQSEGLFNRNDLPVRNPQAMFKYMQPDELGNQMPMFDVQGAPNLSNPSGGSDLSLQSLGERGIDLVEGPLPANRTPPIRRTLSPFGEAEGTKAISEIPSGVGANPEGIVEMGAGIKPPSPKLQPSKGPAGPAVDKLLNNIQQSKGIRTKQEAIYKQERARRFAAFEGVSEGGVSGAKQSLGKLKGEYDKINRTALDMSPEETDSLFNAVKGSYLTTPEKARAYSTLFKILEGGGVPQRNELKLLDDVFSDGFAEKFIEMHGGLGATGIKIGKTANTMKSLMSSADLSAPLRQGIGLIHRPEWRDSFGEMFKYLTNKEYFDNAMLALHERPNYQLGRESGLFLAKPDNLLSGEEAFMNSYVHNLPVIKNIVGASERAYTGFLNKLRADTFDNLLKNAKDMGHNPNDIAKNLAKYVNVSTGRGSLGTLEKMAPELNTILWSPRLISSRLSILNPKYYIDADPFTRKEAIKSLLAIAATGTTIAGLGKAAGGGVSLNPLSSDFGKTRFGTHVLDPWAGFQQPIVAASRMIAEANRMMTGGKKQFGQPNIPEIAGRFMVNKLAPATGLAYDVATAKAFTGGGKFTDRFGNKKSVQGETLKRFVPIFTQDLQQLLQSDPSFAESVGLGGAALFGAGVQDYPERTPNAPLRRKMSLSF